MKIYSKKEFNELQLKKIEEIKKDTLPAFKLKKGNFLVQFA